MHAQASPVVLGLAATLLSLVLPLPAVAQLVIGRIVEEGSGAPVEGVFIALVDATGERRAGTLSLPDGTYTLRAPEPGRYHLRGDRIGYRSIESATFRLEEGRTVRQDITAPTEAVSLVGIEVEGTRRCDMGASDGGRTQALWEEATKALTVAAWAQESGFGYRTVKYTRRLDAAGRTVLSESSTRDRGWGRHAFRSISADSLDALGYVRNDGMERAYFAPDAEVLLSPSFLESHCFRATREEGRVGLAFEPAPGVDRPNIEGVLWLDEETSQLQKVEFRYTGIAPDAGHPRIGGEVEFERVGGGAWLVRRWAIRMPELGFRAATHDQPGEAMVLGIREMGGMVTDVRAPGERQTFDRDRGGVEGRVTDAATGEALWGAEVRLSGTNYVEPVDAQGRFTLDRVLSGSYTATFSHPRLDSLGVAGPRIPVTVEPSGRAEVHLEAPPVQAVVADACSGAPEPDRYDRTARVGGVVWGARDGSPLPGATVEVRWVTVERRSDGLVQHEQGESLQADRRGRYVFCAVPAEEALWVRALVDDEAGREIRLDPMIQGAVGWVHLEVEEPRVRGR